MGSAGRRAGIARFRYASAFAFYGVGAGVDQLGLSKATAGIARVSGSGLVGGISTRVQGGRFNAGVLSALVPATATEAGVVGGALSRMGVEADNYLGNVVGAAVIGGTASELGGGKFGNGAVTGAFSYVVWRATHALAAGRGAQAQAGRMIC
jgi:hypothetical protein